MAGRGRKRPAAATDAPLQAHWLDSATIIPKDKIVVAKSKVDAVESFLVNAQTTPKSILVLHGPSGCGKTTLIRSVASHLHLKLHQIDELIDMDFCDAARPADDYLDRACVQSSKFPPLTLYAPGEPAAAAAAAVHCRPSSRHGRIIFVDDLEGVADSSLLHLARTLKTVERGVFVLTCSDWFAVCKQCPALKDLDSHCLALNPLAPTFIKKAVEGWTANGALPQALLDSGDLRACLHHAYLQGIAKDLDPVPPSARDAGLTMFHALGRLFYPLKNIGDLFNPCIPEDRSLFHLYVHHNMLPFMSSIDEAAAVLDALSMDDHGTSGVPLVEYTLAVLINSKGAVRVRPTFTRPDYLDMKKRAPTKQPSF